MSEAAPAPDPSAVLAALGVHGATFVEPATGGFDTAVWRVILQDRPHALRLFRPGQNTRCAHECAAMATAVAHGIPAPSVQVVGAYHDRPALLSDWCPGRTLLAELVARPERAAMLGRLFGQTQAAIHAIPAPPVLPADWRDAAGPLALHLPFPPLTPDALIHLDYHPLNVLTDGARITGVIDWTNARAGDPRADLARTITILRLDAQSHPDLVPPQVRAVLPLFERGWRQGYTQAAGPGATTDLAPFHAWAGAAMERDLVGKRDEAFVRRVKAWTERWVARAGVPPVPPAPEGNAPRRSWPTR